jgi:hypothetical protein
LSIERGVEVILVEVVVLSGVSGDFLEVEFDVDGTRGLDEEE